MSWTRSGGIEWAVSPRSSWVSATSQSSPCTPMLEFPRTVAAILGLSVFTDFLFVPVALALYLALKGVNRNAMLLATAFVGLFVVLDLAITWSHYASILTLYRDYSKAADDAQRAGYLAAANYASAILTALWKSCMQS